MITPAKNLTNAELARRLQTKEYDGWGPSYAEIVLREAEVEALARILEGLFRPDGRPNNGQEG